MKEQPHWTNVLTSEFFAEHYVKERKSYPELRELLASMGYNIGVGTIHKYAKNLGFGRTISEGCRNLDPNPLDFTISYMDERTIEAIDGFLLGDGGIYVEDTNIVTAARLSCSLQYKEFCNYLMKYFTAYNPIVKDYKDSSMGSGIVWQGRTKIHPDIYQQHRRWYPDDGKKQPPSDVRITPLSVMMWYLGDGSLVVNEEKNTIMLRLSTDGFSPERVEFLSQKLRDKGIACHRNNDNRIMVEAKGISKFFDFIGKTSPVECYKYKFELPAWRLEMKRMREVADELGMDYHRLSYLVKIGKVPCFRASEGGKPRFSQAHIEQIRNLIPHV